MSLSERVRSLALIWQRRRISRDIAAEWQFHLEAHAASLREQGLSSSDAAREAARAFGSQTRWQERTWDELGISWLDELWNDLRFAARVLWKDRTFTIAALTTLAVCLGSYTAAFAVVDHALLHPLQIPHPERVVAVYNSYPLAGSLHAGATGPDYVERASLPVFEQQALYRTVSVNATFGDRSVRVPAMQVTPSFFTLVGVSPRTGRAFTASESEPGGEKVAIVTAGFVRQQFPSGDALGSSVRVEGEPYTIVGVMPDRFSFVDPRVEIWTPLALTDRDKTQRYSNNFAYVARLKAGVSVAQAQHAIDALNAGNLERYPETKPVLSAAGFHSVATPLTDDLTRDVRFALYLLWAGAAGVVLIGCINVSILVLARASARRHELDTRLALGAGAGRIVRQLVAEQVLLTCTSGALGLLVGHGILLRLGAIGRSDVAPWTSVAIDGRVAVQMLAIAAIVGVALGCMPLVDGALARRGLLSDGGRSNTHGLRFRLLRRSLVGVQVASAFMLVLVSLLLLTSFRQLLRTDPGFDPRDVVTASVGLPAARYTTDAATRFVDEALRRLRDAPGVQQAGATTTVPFDRALTQDVMLPEGYRLAPGSTLTAAYHTTITPGYMEAMGIALEDGRYFDERDTADSPRVVIVDERLARRFWPGRNPVGTRMYAPSNPQDLTAVTATTRWFAVVGVVRDVTLRGPGQSGDDIGAFYTVQRQLPRRDLTFAVRGPVDAGVLVRNIVRDLDSDIAVFDVRTMTARAEGALSERRLSVRLAGLFGVVALVLCGAGVYGVLAYVVSQRRIELAIRLALGAAPRAVAGSVVRETLLLCGIGLASGGLLTVATLGIVRAQLAGVAAVPSSLVAGVGALLLTVSLTACAIPAYRASRIDAASTLRT